MRAWNDRDPVGFEAEKAEVEQACPHLHFSVIDGQVTVTGSLEIKEGHKVFDRFSIRDSALGKLS